MDTVRLKFSHYLPKTSFFKDKVLSKVLALESGAGKRYIFTNNEWRKQRQAQGLYTPKYWIEEDVVIPSNTFFYIECSLPKLHWGQNITEPTDTDLEPIVASLRAFLREIEVYVSTGQILNATPTLVAVGKNIDLTRFCSVDLTLKALSPFDFKPKTKHRFIDFLDCEHGGRQIIFSKKEETLKLYNKLSEVANNAITDKEKAVRQAVEKQRYRSEAIYVNEMLRTELTLKTRRKIENRFKKYLPTGQEVNFQNLFKKSIWDKLLAEEIATVYMHPLRHFVFLAQENKPIIEAFLDKNHKHIETKDTVMGIIGSLQEYGLAQTRQRYLAKYDSRQTWYNYLKRFKKIDEAYDFSSLANSDNYKIYCHILGQFGLDTAAQASFDFDTLSKKLDSEQCNTNCDKLTATKAASPSSVLLSDNLYGC